jgi:hypothetical protein
MSAILTDRKSSDWAVFISGEVLVFRSPDVPITRSFAALCLRPSARDPTPHRALLQTKAKPQFDRAVDRTVEAFFIVF